MKIRTRAYMLGMLPALLLAAILLLYLSASRLSDLETALRNRGAALARYIAQGAQYAVVSGNVAAMQPILEQAKLEADVVHVAIYRPDGNPIVHFGTPPVDLAVPLRRTVEDTPNHIAFSVPVEIATPSMDDLFLPEVRNMGREVAWVQVTMSRSGNEKIARVMLTNSLLIVGVGILFTLILARILALTGIKPLMEIIAVVRRISTGDLSGRLPLNAKSELKTLQIGINQMSEALASNQHELLARVESATAELALQKEAAEQANIAKSKFIATASHDLRQPMHALGLFAATLKEQASTAEQITLVEKIEASVNAQEEMFNALLDISRLEAGNMHPHVQTFAVQNILDSIVRNYATQAREQGLRLIVRYQPLAVRSDPVLLARILSNLLNNALRYTTHGGVVVAARKHGDKVRIQVWDTGIGISEADLPRIFEEYFQGGNAGRNRLHGVGLGLNIVWRMCHLLDHPLEVRSIPGRGSVFSLTVPRGDSNAMERRRIASRDWNRFNQQWVVVIEDDLIVRDALQGLLTGWGLNVLAAETADEVLASAQSDIIPALVISDYRLAQGQTGIAAIARLQEVWGDDLPAILVSGDTSSESVLTMAASGLTALHKPVRPAKLRALLQNLLYP